VFFCHSGLDPESSDFAFLFLKNKELRITNVEHSSRWIPAGVYPVLDTGPV